MTKTDGTSSAPLAGKIVGSPVGDLILAATDAGLTHLLFAKEAADRPTVVAATGQAATIVAEAERQLSEYFAGRRTEFDLPLAPSGTAFQRETWQALRTIPYGETISYGELAKRIDRPRAVRAVGTANGANPISIVVPCHRVIGSDGSLTGYGGGLENKRKLLSLEGSLL